MLAGRHVVLGISGGVAAYKAAYLARRLVEHGARVRVVMTPSATEFIGPATLAALTGTHPVVDLFDDADVSPHTSLARWADIVVVAPATAATIAKIAGGDSSNALVATVLATTAPVVIAPAMHTEMWENEATVRNIDQLATDGRTIVPPEEGELAGGDVGVGRLAEPDTILALVDAHLDVGPLAGRTVLITAGGTREAIDPVRYIGNRSSGKMGNALARAAAARGAAVRLVTAAPAPEVPGVVVVPVESAADMDTAVRASGAVDIAIMAAAVADFRPTTSTSTKLRREAGPPSIDLEPTPDVLAGVREREQAGILVGFAAETGSLAEATEKARRKDVDLLVANDVAREGSGFGSDTNQVTLIGRDGSPRELPLMSKEEVAAAILDAIVELGD